MRRSWSLAALILALGAPRGPDAAAQMLDLLGLAEAADRKVSTYSKGMQQRAGLAQALMNNPDLLLLDEPLSGLDPVGRAQIRDVILEQAATGLTEWRRNEAEGGS